MQIVNYAYSRLIVCYEGGSPGDLESSSRKSCCCLCPNFAPLNRKAKRHPKFKYCILSSQAGNDTLKQLRDIFPDYSTDKRGVPEAICPKHYSEVLLHKSRPRFSANEIQTLNSRFKTAPKIRQSTSNSSTPLYKLCQKRLENPQYPEANLPEEDEESESESESDTKEDEKFLMLKTPPKKKRRGNSQKLRRSPRLKEAHLLQAGIESKMSGRRIQKHTDALRMQRERGEHSVKLPSGHTVRKRRSELNKAFRNEFESIDTKLCPDTGAAVMCVDVEDFLLQVIYCIGVTRQQVKVVKFNLDGGRGSQKLMTQMIYSGDPILRNNATEEQRKAYADARGGYKDTSVMRTLILGKMSGCSESHECTKFFFDKLVDKKKLQKTFPNAKIFSPNDLKQSNKACGLGEHGSRNPMHTSRWSQFSAHSDPQFLRTGHSIMQNLKKRLKAEAKGENSEPKNFHSVHCEPVKMLKDDPKTPTVYIFCPPQLHLNLGIAVHFVQAVECLDSELCADWEDELGVTRDEKHGGTRT